MSYRWQCMRPVLGADQAVAYTTSTQSSALGGTNQSFIVRLIATTDCHILIGKNPTATTTNTFLASKQYEYFAVTPGEKIAVVQDSSGGTLYISEMTN